MATSDTPVLPAQDILQCASETENDALVLARLMHPFSVCHLGWFTLAAHICDAPARASFVSGILQERFGVKFSDIEVTYCFTRLQKHMPQTLAQRSTAFASLRPFRAECRLAKLVLQYAPALSCMCVCGAPLHAWKSYDAPFLTFGSGFQNGKIVFLRCNNSACSRVYGGSWCWKDVPLSARFPQGFHGCEYCGASAFIFKEARWYFATPSLVVEVTLLRFMLQMMRVGGLSFTSLWHVYFTLWRSTFGDMQYTARQHFVGHLLVTWLTWACVRLLVTESADQLRHFLWYLRPHHLAEDFLQLSILMDTVFHSSTRKHHCDLIQAFPGVIIDAQWSFSSVLCNDRFTSTEWDSSLRIGFCKGCSARCTGGSVYCSTHVQDLSFVQEEQRLSNHRVTNKDSGLKIEFKTKDDMWIDRRDISPRRIRSYEMSLLRRRSRFPTGAEDCKTENHEEEHHVARRHGGVMVAISPCLYILAVRPMYASESPTQCLLFVQTLLLMFTWLRFVVYDNACTIVRVLVRALASCLPDIKCHWQRLRDLIWIVDRLHYHTHKCRDPSSKYYLPEVSPVQCDELVGVDSEAAEQTFSIFKKWQRSACDMHDVHMRITLLILSHERNTHNQCSKLFKSYLRKRAANDLNATKSTSNSSSRLPCPTKNSVDDVELDSECCDSLVQKQTTMKRLKLDMQCGRSLEDDIDGNSIPGRRKPRDIPLRAIMLQTLVVANENSKTLHPVSDDNSGFTDCGWFFAEKSLTPTPCHELSADVWRTYFVCGRCCGLRSLLHLACSQET